MIGWESDVSCQDQLQSGIEQNQSNLDYFQQIVSEISLSLMFRKANGINDLFCVGHVFKFFRGFCVSTQCVMRSTWWLWWKRKLIHTSLFLFNSTWHHTPKNFWWETNKIKVECPLLSTWLFSCFWWKVAPTQQAYSFNSTVGIVKSP